MNAPPESIECPRYAIVTGGGSGIGRALCERLSSLGWAVAVVDLDGAAADETITRLPTPSSQSHAAPMDVADPAAWDELIAELRDRWPRLDLLVNNAGCLIGGPLQDASPEAICRAVKVNLLGPLFGARAAAPWLVDSAARGVPADGLSPLSGVINTASIFATLAPPEFATYSASKAGVVALSESLRGELAPQGLNVTVALPGTVPTGLFATASFTSPATAGMARRFADKAELTAEMVAAKMLRAAHRGELYTVIGREARRFARLKRWLPALTSRRIATRTYRELAASIEPQASVSDAAPLTAPS